MPLLVNLFGNAAQITNKNPEDSEDQDEDEQEHQHKTGRNQKLNHNSTSHQIFQVIEQESTGSIRKTTDDTPLEVVEKLHGHIFLPFQLVPEPAQLTKQVVVKLKVHIQRMGLL